MQNINSIHFLVHPGWWLLTGYAPWLYPRDKFIKSEDLKQRFNDLLQAYIDKATGLAPDELMVLFAPQNNEDFIKAVRSYENENLPVQPRDPLGYVVVVKKIKEILEDRLIVLADNDRDEENGAILEKNRERIWNRIVAIAQARGFQISDQFEAEAYGESITACVTWIANHMHEAAGMPAEKVISIPSHLTDYAVFKHDPESHWVWADIQAAEERGDSSHNHMDEGMRRSNYDFDGMKGNPVITKFEPRSGHRR